LISEEIGTKGVVYLNSDGQTPTDYAIEIENGNFYWTDPKQMSYLEEKKQHESLSKSKNPGCASAKKPAKENYRRHVNPEQATSESNPLLAQADSESTNGSLEMTPELQLKDINIKIQKGSCVAIIGKVGSGKSSLLSSLFGELHQ
jgi:ABC-type glutathione transport system ATPase component